MITLADPNNGPFELNGTAVSGGRQDKSRMSNGAVTYSTFYHVFLLAGLICK